MLSRSAADLERIARAHPERAVAVPEVREEVVALETGEQDGRIRRVEARRGRAVAGRKQRLPRQRVAAAVLPHRAVVLQAADLPPQRIRRIDGHVVELQRLQASCSGNTGGSGRPPACVWQAMLVPQIDEARLRMSTNVPSLRTTPPSDPTHAMFASRGWNTMARTSTWLSLRVGWPSVANVEKLAPASVDRIVASPNDEWSCAADQNRVRLPRRRHDDEVVEALRTAHAAARESRLRGAVRRQRNPRGRVRQRRARPGHELARPARPRCPPIEPLRRHGFRAVVDVESSSCRS